ncbi:hypothetical protein BDR03DRAFT_1017943 [Suillus americanus]|nr:hypothetical protein BDR03DRAFT_1017943 [Suillus americanus]
MVRFEPWFGTGPRQHYIEQIRKSPQARAFFRKACKEENVPELELLQWIRTRWVSLYKCLDRMLMLRQAINHFTNLADESHEVPTLRNKTYDNFKLNRSNWRHLGLIHRVLKEPATAHISNCAPHWNSDVYSGYSWASG